MRPGEIILPRDAKDPVARSFSIEDREKAGSLSSWLNAKVGYMQRVWADAKYQNILCGALPLELRLGELERLILSRRFNYQAKGRVAHLVPEMRCVLARQVGANKPITVFFLYNGGYRASPFPGRRDLIFSPDQTELMLLYQISLLQESVGRIHAPGVDFVIVVNNGVAHRVNDIPLEMTDTYIAGLRDLIALVGASSHIRVLAQSETAKGNKRELREEVPAVQPITAEDHYLVERFLGRVCLREEAQHRYALYQMEEGRWADELGCLARQEGALLMRQVASPSMLSFRPFPGGATRVQNGTLGFYRHGQDFVPSLVTSRNYRENLIIEFPFDHSALEPAFDLELRYA